MDKLLSGQRVLVVEDEMMVLMTIEGMLEDLGCKSITTAATIDQAIDLIDAQIFDVAMLDVNLNGVKSYPVAAALVSHGVPFCFSTGYADHGPTEDYNDRPVLRKPYPYQKLSDMFAHLLEHRQAAN